MRKYHKSSTIYSWKSIGVISDDFDKLYEEHMKINNCQLCNIDFNEDIRNQHRCLDHDHKTGLYRQTICNKCNRNFDRKQDCISIRNKSGYKNISFHKHKKKWRYNKMINGNKIEKYFKTIEDAISYSQTLISS